MSNKQQIETHKTPSALDRFSLNYEYNKSLTEIKRDVRIRTI